MKILHVTSWLSRSGGGIPPVIWALARETCRRGIEASVVGLKDRWVENDCKPDGFPFAAADVLGPAAFGFSPQLQMHLAAVAQSPGVIHSHGLWMYPGLVARKCAVQKGCALMISPHGMLEPWALNHSRWKKKLAEALFEQKNFQQAACLHALCRAEAKHFRSYGLKNPIAIIPNGVDPETLPSPSPDAFVKKFPETKDRQRVLFLSRLHSKKGLENLLTAWKKLAPSFKDWQLLIAGSGDPAYENELKTFSGNLITDHSVVFLGPVYGEEKRNALAAAEVFVLPSFSEGFSVAVLEAAAAGLPVVLTPECNFPELVVANAAVEISTDAIGIERGLRRILDLPPAQRKAMGRRGRELINSSYTWPAIAQQMCRVYDWLAGTTAKPETVELV